MITTTEYKNIQTTLIHRITGEINTEEVKIGIDELVKILDKAVQKHGTINLIINAKGVNFASLIAHRTWSQGLDNFPTIREKINYCAFVLDDSPNGRAEKEFMDSERLKFFFDFDEGINWLRDKIEV
jgi:hypothetical protein